MQSYTDLGSEGCTFDNGQVVISNVFGSFNQSGGATIPNPSTPVFVSQYMSDPYITGATVDLGNPPTIANSGPIEVFPGQSASGTFGFTVTDIAGARYVAVSGDYGFSYFNGPATTGTNTNGLNSDSGAICIGASIDSQGNCAGTKIPIAWGFGPVANVAGGHSNSFQMPEGVNTVSFLFSFDISLPQDSAIADVGQVGPGGTLNIQTVPEPSTITLAFSAVMATLADAVVRRSSLHGCRL